MRVSWFWRGYSVLWGLALICALVTIVEVSRLIHWQQPLLPVGWYALALAVWTTLFVAIIVAMMLRQPAQTERQSED